MYINKGYERIPDRSSQTLDTHQEDNDVKLYGYRKTGRRFLFNLCCIFLFGFPALLLKWFPKFCFLKYKRVLLKDAELVLVQTNYGYKSLIKVQQQSTHIAAYGSKIRYFYFQYSKYVWNIELEEFVHLEQTQPITLSQLREEFNPLTQEQHDELLEFYGPNKIEVEVKSYWKLFIDEVFHPFYVFQLFSITLWTFDEYYFYAVCIVLLSLFSMIVSLYRTRKQSLALHNLAAASSISKIQVSRTRGNSPDYEIVDATSLVPSDIIVIPPEEMIMPCDAVLLAGSCIVNESVLTGESVPVMKTPPNSSEEIYDSVVHKRHSLYAGTHIIQSRIHGGDKVLARVVHTGFDTSKGELLKSILHPKPVHFRFNQDSYKFIGFLFILATMGMAYCLYVYILRKADTVTIIVRTLDIMTIIIPPALPAAMTIGITYSQSRLKKFGIFCISPPRINVCGKVKLICFDKTGTLTEEGLHFCCAVPSTNSVFSECVTDVTVLNQKSPFVQAMASCHSLTSINGRISGDPLDINIFSATKWLMNEPGEELSRYDMLAPTVVRPPYTDANEIFPYEIAVINQFTFSSIQQCMSVICATLDPLSMQVFTKGAPEKVADMCLSASLPKNFHSVVSEYASEGYRVIAVAGKSLPTDFRWIDAQKAKRENIEYDLNFLGLIVLQNNLKPETAPVIKELRGAKIRTVMVTGDNVMTAISVARKCEMIYSHEQLLLVEAGNSVDLERPKITGRVVYGGFHGETHLNMDNTAFKLAMDGRTWSAIRDYYPELLDEVVLHGRIFARFKPDQKTQLVVQLQKLDYVVAMCGDGANDCGALKAADVGISLSEAEASVAAPFTSTTPNICCVKHILLEGRCSLATSFAVFKYVAMYSFIQFATVLILYGKATVMGDTQFLFIDLIITTSLAIAMGRQAPTRELMAKRPTGSLMSIKTIIPLVLQMVLCALIQTGALIYLVEQPWFVPHHLKVEAAIQCWENTVLFTISCYQYIILAIVYSRGRHFRQSLLKNNVFIITALSLLCFTSLLLLHPVEPLDKFFDLIPISGKAHQRYFRYQLLIFPIIHLVLSVMIETCVAETAWFRKTVHFLKRKTEPKNRFKVLEQQPNDLDWIQRPHQTKNTIQV